MTQPSWKDTILAAAELAEQREIAQSTAAKKHYEQMKDVPLPVMDWIKTVFEDYSCTFIQRLNDGTKAGLHVVISNTSGDDELQRYAAEIVRWATTNRSERTGRPVLVQEGDAEHVLHYLFKVRAYARDEDVNLDE